MLAKHQMCFSVQWSSSSKRIYNVICFLIIISSFNPIIPTFFKHRHPLETKFFDYYRFHYFLRCLCISEKFGASWMYIISIGTQIQILTEQITWRYPAFVWSVKERIKWKCLYFRLAQQTWVYLGLVLKKLRSQYITT